MQSTPLAAIPKKTKDQKRIDEHPDEPLSLVKNKLDCNAFYQNASSYEGNCGKYLRNFKHKVN